MSQTEGIAVALAQRATCPSGYYYSSGYCYANSSWSWWGRWVFAGVVIIFVIAILLMLGCVNARRRRRRGLTPMYGTGWMSKPAGSAGAPYAPQGGYGNTYGNNTYGNNTYGNNAYGPPAYTPPNPQHTGNTFTANDGYYGQPNEGIQLQQPANTYARGADQGYEPPPGPPPSKIA